MMLRGECSELSMPAHLTNENESGLWPTPSACKAGNDTNLRCSGDGRQKPNKLGWAVALWPTPNARDYKGAPGAGCIARGGRQSSLPAAVKQWPTPTVQDSKNNGAPSQMERNTKPLNAEVGGPLNPTWVEWLMGWPLGWTDCAASATDRFQQWLRSHSQF
jgi:hypothetical protein